LSYLSQFSGFQMLRVDDLFCTDGFCDFLSEGIPLFSDSSHIGLFGTRLLDSRLRELFQENGPEKVGGKNVR
jgi:hypothetical protein